MSNSIETGCFGIAIVLITALISIGSGLLAWAWIQPEGFGGAIIFIIVWGLLSKLGHVVAMGVAAIFFR
jgi:hypothetical protein